MIQPENTFAERGFWPLLKSAGIVFFDLDRDGEVRWVEGAVEDLLGWRPDEIAGRRLCDLGPSELAEEVSGRVAAQAADARQTQPGRLAVLTRQGRRVDLVFTLAAARGADPDAGLVGIGYRCPPVRVPAGAAGVSLTPRQLEVLLLLAEGLGTLGIAERLQIAKETARNHVRGVLHELNCHTRLEAVAEARRLGLI